MLGPNWLALYSPREGTRHRTLHGPTERMAEADAVVQCSKQMSSPPRGGMCERLKQAVLKTA